MATLLDKIWQRHLVTTLDNGDDLLYIDLHLIHEVTSPQAFDGLRLAHRKVRRPDKSFATMDHNVPTQDRLQIKDPASLAQIQALERNCVEFGIRLFDLKDDRQGIVHVIGPELGLTHPGDTIVCGDSHTSTHGAFGALAFGIGTSEVEHVLATQCLIQRKPQSLEVLFRGKIGPGISSKDLILNLIGQIGSAGATGMVIEYTGEILKEFSMEARMTICNMSIEAGARAGLIPPDDTTFSYLKQSDREFAPKGTAWKKSLEYWNTLFTDSPEDYDQRVEVDIENLVPQVTWGTRPDMVTDITGKIPTPKETSAMAPKDMKHALEYMGLTSGTLMNEIPIDVVFIGSCTNARIEDLREAAHILKGKKVAQNVQVLVVPGSTQVLKQAEKEGLDQIFIEAGCDWRQAGCSMCLAMNPDKLLPQQRAASTSNRNFEGRQGKGGRTHLVSPITAAASAIRGKLTDPREYI